MRRGQQLRRIESQPGPIRGRRRRHLTSETPPPPLRRSLRLSQSSASLSIETPETPSNVYNSTTSPINQSNITNTSSSPARRTIETRSLLEVRATEAESARSRSRQRSRVRQSGEPLRTDTSTSRAITRDSRRTSRERAGPRDSLPELPGTRQEEINRSLPATRAPVTPVRRIIRARQRIPHERAMASENSQERTYTMEFAIPPPRYVRVGEDISPPLAVHVRIRDAIADMEISGEDELSYLFVAAALYDESGGSAPIAPPDSGLISGRLSGSLELLNEYYGYEDGRPMIDNPDIPFHLQQGSFVLFNNLRINRPGNYRLGITLLRVGGGRMPFGRRPRSEGGMSLAEVMSETICVQTEEVPEMPLGIEAREFLQHLRNRGFDVPSPS